MSAFVYIATNKTEGTLYTGLTTSLTKRVDEHRIKAVKGFTYKYNCDRLVYYEIHDSLEVAAQRERQIKKWRRAWKEELIEKLNPQWEDLFEKVCA